MFQFSEEFDEEVEDFLSVSLDGSCSKNVVNHIGKENMNATHINTDQVNPSATKDEFVFDNFGEDEELLSFVDNIDSTFNQSVQNSSLNVSSLSCSSERTNRTPSKQSNAVATKKKHVQEQLDCFVTKKPVTSKRSSAFVTVKDESPSLLKLKYEREFPGPAGLRLKRSRDSLLNEESNSTGFGQQLNVSVVNDFLSENINWFEMMKDINAQSCELSKIMNEFTVVALKRLGNVARKVPLFAAVIFNVNASTSEPSVILKDPTGEIRASFDEDLWGQYSHLLTIGSALLLRKVGMLSKSRRLSLLVTTHNVDTIYSLKPGDETSVLITRVTPSTILDALYERNDFVKTAIKRSSTTISSNDGTVGTIETSRNADLSSNFSRSVPGVTYVDNIITPASRLANSHKKDISVPSSVPSINNELEGIDLDSLLGDF